MADREPLRVKISSKRITSGRWAWSVALEKQFLLSRSDLPRRVKLVNEDRKLFLQYGDSGAQFGMLGVGKYAWAVFSNVTMVNFYLPTEQMLVVELDGLLDSETQKIEINSEDYPDAIFRSMQPPPEPSLLGNSPTDQFKVKPRQVNQVKQPKLRDLLVEETTNHRSLTREPNEKASSLVPYALPNRVTLWHDENIRNLRALIMDLQSKRPDIIFQVVNGIVTMRRQVFEDI